MINKFRKVASVLTSAVMLASTVGIAAAANYPAPFVKNGMSDVAVVWGSASQASDLVAVTDVTADLQAELAAQTASSGGASSGSTVEGGDYVRLAKSSDNLNVGNTMSGVFGTRVDNEDLPELLADGTYLNDENTEYDYEQSISLAALTLTHFAESDYNDKEPTVGFSLDSDAYVMNYTLDFVTDAESDVDSGNLVDFETTDINILGKSYYILDAQNGTGSTIMGKFTLLDSANTAIVAEGESQTVSVGDKTYSVSINFIGSTTVKLDVDGQVTNTLSAGETFKLSDGTYVGVKDILYNSKDGGVSKAEFSIGSGKLELTSGSELELNDENVDGLVGYIYKGSVSGGKTTIDKIQLMWSTDDDEFITADSDLTMPGFGAVKFSMGDFVTPSKEVVQVENDGDDSIELTVPIKDGSANFNILYANSSGEYAGIGKASDEKLATSAGSTLLFNATSGGDKWFVASYATTSEAESYLLSATVDEKDNKNRTTIKNVVTGSNVCEDKAAGDSCNIGSVSLTVTSVHKTGSHKNVTLTAGSSVNFTTIYTKEGLKLVLPFLAANSSAARVGGVNFSVTNASQNAANNYDSVVLVFTEENKDDDIAQGSSFNVTVNDNSDGDVEVSDIATGASEFEVEESDVFVSMVASDLATRVSINTGGDQDTAEIEYHGSESFADVYLTAVGATVSSDGSVSSSGSVKKLGSVSVSDSEVSSVSSKNLIVVGGSAVNSVAADLLGGAFGGAAFEEATGAGAGQFVIETFSRAGGKVATLVAGYNAADTTNAAKYLTTQSVDTTVGKRYVGTSSTSASLVTESA